MSIMETIFRLSKAVSYVLRTFHSETDRDLEGLSMRLFFLDKISEFKLCKHLFDIEEEEEITAWINKYINEIKDDLIDRLKNYQKILNGQTLPSREKLEFREEVARDQAVAVYNNEVYEKIFYYCNRCPVRYFCFCELKTFLVCVFSGKLYNRRNSRLKELLEGKLLFIKPKIDEWLKENFLDESRPEYDVFRTGFPYLIRKAVNQYVENFKIPIEDLPQLAEGGDFDKKAYKNIDPFVTMSLIQLLSEKSFKKHFVSRELWLDRDRGEGKSKERFRNAINTIMKLQNRDEHSRLIRKEFIFDSGDSHFRTFQYPVYGSWKEGFWGGTKVERVKSTADIARLLFELEGWSEAVEAALEFVVMGFMRKVDDTDPYSGFYILDESTFRRIEVSNISNTSGTISALRFLLKVKDKIIEKGAFQKILEKLQQRIIDEDEFLEGLDEEVLKELNKPEHFIRKRIDWLISQQNADGSYPILSKKFIDVAGNCSNWLKPILHGPKGAKFNISFNNTIEAILLMLEYHKEYQKEESKLVPT